MVTTSCGTQFFSRVVSQNAAATITSTSFQTLTSFSFSVPSGSARCIKVLFTGEAACAGTTGSDFCYIRAIVNGVELFPSGGSFQALQSEDSTAAAHAYERYRRLGAGTYTVSVQVRTGTAGTSFFLDDWTADFQLTN